MNTIPCVLHAEIHRSCIHPLVELVRPCYGTLTCMFLLRGQAAQSAFGASSKWSSWTNKGTAAPVPGAKKGPHGSKAPAATSTDLDSGRVEPMDVDEPAPAVMAPRLPHSANAGGTPLRHVLQRCASAATMCRGPDCLTCLDGSPHALGLRNFCCFKCAGVPGASTPTPGMLWSSDQGPVVTVKDLIAALEKDPLYAKSSLMYQLVESADLFPL